MVRETYLGTIFLDLRALDILYPGGRREGSKLTKVRNTKG